ncbi:MAG: YceI family protein [Pseudomonadota bacterium]
MILRNRTDRTVGATLLLMRKLSATALIPIMLATALTSAAWAEPARYLLDAPRSQVGFTYYFGTSSDDGTMPLASADLVIDLDNLSASQIDVAVDASGARTGFFLATQALRGAQVLDTDRHPLIRFRSERVRAVGTRVDIEGSFTIRGVTRPGQLTAQLFQQPGNLDAPGRDLSLLLTGAVNRSEFGADGFAGQVGDRVDLRILARISRQ